MRGAVLINSMHVRLNAWIGNILIQTIEIPFPNSSVLYTPPRAVQKTPPVQLHTSSSKTVEVILTTPTSQIVENRADHVTLQPCIIRIQQRFSLS